MGGQGSGKARGRAAQSDDHFPANVEAAKIVVIVLGDRLPIADEDHFGLDRLAGLAGTSEDGVAAQFEWDDLAVA